MNEEIDFKKGLPFRNLETLDMLLFSMCKKF